MADGMDLVELRRILGIVVGGLGGRYRHADLGEACVGLGLPEPPDEGTKYERVSHSFAALPDTDLPLVAERVLDQLSVDAVIRNAIQDILWADQGTLEMPK